MKGMLKKLLIILMLITVFNTSLISSFSDAATLDTAYLDLRGGLNTDQRLAIVNAGNYLQTSRFPFLIYCLDGYNHTVSMDFVDSVAQCDNQTGGKLMQRFPNNVKLTSLIKTQTSKTDGVFITSCANYCCYIYRHVLGLTGEEYNKYFSASCSRWINLLLECQRNGDENCPLEIVDGWNFDEIMPGDIIIYSWNDWNGKELLSGTSTSGHAMLYLGKNGVADSSKQNSENAIAHASGHNTNIVTTYIDYENVVNPEGKTSGVRRCYTIRINPNFELPKLQENGNILEIFDEDFGQYVDGALEDFMSNGYLQTLNMDDTNAINYGKFTSSKGFGDQIIDTLSQVIDVILGFLILPLKVIIIGWSGVIQQLVTTFISAATGVPSSDLITVEKIVYNQVPLLDANFFNLEYAGGEELTPGSVIYVIRKSISTWYNIIRGVGIAGMLVSLLYMGIRMAISSVSEEKAKYKKMLKDWVVSFIILMTMHYIMILIIQVNEQILTFLREGVANESSLYEQLLIRAYDMRLSVGVPATLMYIVLVVFSALYFVAYLKRFFTLIILTIFSPIIAISYAIDKVKDGKSQSFTGWLKEYIYTVIMQSIHALLYVIFVSVSINMALGGMNVKPSGEVEPDVAAINIVSALGNLIPALVFMIVSLNLESIFKSIFKIAPKGMDDVVASKEEALGYWHMTRNAGEKVTSFVGSEYKYWIDKNRAKDTRTEFEKQANPSAIDSFDNAINTVKQELTSGIEMAKTLVTEGPKYLALKALETPEFNGLYKIRHPFKFKNLTKYYASGGKSISSSEANKQESIRIKMQINLSHIMQPNQNAQPEDEFLTGLSNGFLKTRKDSIKKIIKKVASGTSSEDAKRSLEKIIGITEEEKEEASKLIETVENERKAKIDLAKEKKKKELLTEIDELKATLQRREKARIKTLCRYGLKKEHEKNPEISLEELKKDKKLMSKIMLQAKKQAQKETADLMKKERKQVVNEILNFATLGIDKIVCQEIKKDIENMWKQLDSSD